MNDDDAPLLMNRWAPIYLLFLSFIGSGRVLVLSGRWVPQGYTPYLSIVARGRYRSDRDIIMNQKVLILPELARLRE